MSDYNVRIILKEEGLNILSNKLEDGKEILNNADINKKVGNLILLGWNKLNSQNFYLLQHRLYEIGYEDISYRMSCIGESLEDIQEYAHTSEKDKNDYIPFPSIIRTFDDKEIENDLNIYFNNLELDKESEGIDYE